MYIQIHAPITNNAVTIIPNVVIVFIKRSVKPTDAVGSVGCKRLLLHLHFK